MKRYFAIILLNVLFTAMFAAHCFGQAGRPPRLDVHINGTPTATYIEKIDIVGSGVTGTQTGKTATITFPAGGGITDGGTTTYITDTSDAFAVGSTTAPAGVKSYVEGNFLASGTVTADSFAGNGSQLTGVGITWSGLTGNPTDNGSITVNSAANTIPFRDANENMFVSGIVGSTITGALRLPIGNTGQRVDSPTPGMIRFNTTINQLEVYTDGYNITGGTVTTDGNYTIHTFLSSDNLVFAPVGWLNVDGSASNNSYNYNGTSTPVFEYLVVAGGGGGRVYHGGGGGGAGGFLTGTGTLSVGTTTITVGAGGAAHTTGNDASIGSIIIAIGGGSGSSEGSGGTTYTGGSGCGANAYGGGVFPPGSGTAGQGYDGGTAMDLGSNNSFGGGGGGASEVGENAYSDNAGDGGDGLLSSISGAGVYYAGGGGGGCGDTAGDTPGTGGLGGGGNGARRVGTAASGVANTGGGGGGCGLGNTPGIGGSGIVIIKYLSTQ